LPVFATVYLRGGADTLGFLSAASGVGALIAAVHLATRRTVLGLGKWVAASPTVLGVGLLAFSFSQSAWLSCLSLLVVGFGMMTHLAASNTILPPIVENDTRGRVMSLFTVAFMGTAPLGSLWTGYLANLIGEAETVRIGALGCIAGSALFALQLGGLRARVRPIYVRKASFPRWPAVFTQPANCW